MRIPLAIADYTYRCGIHNSLSPVKTYLSFVHGFDKLFQIPQNLWRIPQILLRLPRKCMFSEKF